MNLEKDKYIIIELIPTALTKEKGDLIQVSALKINNLVIESRFDYRINEDKIIIPDFKEMISYDKESFTYKETTEEILKDLEEWIEDYPLLILDNTYTNNFLKDINNQKESIAKLLDKEYTDTLIDDLIKENNLEPSNYIVDLLYESIIKKI